MSIKKIFQFIIELLSFNSARAKAINFTSILSILRIIPPEKISNYCIYSNFIIPNLSKYFPSKFSNIHYCPACGLTRATSFFMHLNFRQAFSMNPLVFVLVPLMALMLIVNAYKLAIFQIPNMKTKKPIPKKLPEELNNIVKKVSSKKTKEGAIKTAYEEITKKYKSGNVKSLNRMLSIFNYNIDYLANKANYINCTNMNYILRIILIKSGKLKDKDIKLRIKWVNLYFPHQYLEIKINKKKHIYLDPWAKRYGIKYGNYLKSFKHLK